MHNVIDFIPRSLASRLVVAGLYSRFVILDPPRTVFEFTLFRGTFADMIFEVGQRRKQGIRLVSFRFLIDLWNERILFLRVFFITTGVEVKGTRYILEIVKDKTIFF